MSEEHDSWLEGIGVDVSGILESVQETASSVIETAGQTWDATTQSAGQAWDAGTAGAGQAWDAGTAAAGQAWDTASEVVEEGVEYVEETAAAMADAASEVFDDVKKVVSEVVDEVVEGVKEALDDPTEEAQPDATEASWLPWVQEYQFDKGASPAYLNYEGGKKNIDTNWVRDDVATGLLSVAAGLLAAVALRQIPVSQMVQWYVSGLAGGAATFWRSYKGYQVQMRVTADLAAVHEWYGRYRINAADGTIEAVDFQGRGSTFYTHTTARLQQRLTDAHGNVLYTHPPGDLPIGFDVDSSKNLPEWSFGY